MISRRRPGIALVLALVLLVVLECIVLGVVETARMQHRLAINRARSLDARHLAEGAVRRALVEWPVESLSDPFTIARDTAGTTVRRTFTPLPGSLFLLEAEATAGPPGHPVRHTSALIARAPILAAGDDPGGAALTAATATLTSSAVAGVGPMGDCTTTPAAAVRTAGATLVLPGATVSGRIEEYSPEDLSPRPALERAAADPHLHVAEGDTTLAADASGLLVARGAVTLAAGVRFRGLIIGGGDLEIAADAGATGAIWISGAAEVSGTLIHDACAVDDAVYSARLRAARPLPGRAWVPAF
jgi:hypothetical protein